MKDFPKKPKMVKGYSGTYKFTCDCNTIDENTCKGCKWFFSSPYAYACTGFVRTKGLSQFGLKDIKHRKVPAYCPLKEDIK